MPSQMRFIIVIGTIVVVLAVIAGVAYSAGALNDESRPDELQQVDLGLTGGNAASNEKLSRRSQEVPAALPGTRRNDP
jgi:hypothetical protein